MKIGGRAVIKRSAPSGERPQKSSRQTSLPHTSRSRLAAVLLLLGVVAIWGSTFALVKGALADASPLLFNLLRMAIATVVLLLVHRRALRGIDRRSALAGGVVGLLLATGYQLQTAGLARTSAANSAFITGLVVVFVPGLSLLPFLRSPRVPRPRAIAALGAVIAFAGLALLTTPGGSQPCAMLHALRLGDLLTLGCAIAFAGHLLALSHFADVPAAQLATLQIAVCTLAMLVTLPLGGPALLHLTPRLAAALLITGVLATAVAFTVQSWAQQQLSASSAALLLTLEPVFALLVSVLFLGERPSRRALFGAALIFAGILVTEMLGRRPILPPEPI